MGNATLRDQMLPVIKLVAGLLKVPTNETTFFDLYLLKDYLDYVNKHVDEDELPEKIKTINKAFEGKHDDIIRFMKFFTYWDPESLVL